MAINPRLVDARTKTVHQLSAESKYLLGEPQILVFNTAEIAVDGSFCLQPPRLRARRSAVTPSVCYRAAVASDISHFAVTNRAGQVEMCATVTNADSSNTS